MKKTNEVKKEHQEYKPSEIEPKWQKIWDETGVYKPDLDKAKRPFYNLMMFPYPSAEGMHVGNMYAFTGADVYGRFKRMSGNDVFEPIGLDGFGIHSENYALKIGKHPMEQAKVSEANFYRQLRATGNAYDWSRTVETYNPVYYKWTQWLFTELFKAGLAYRKNAPVNFCPSCKTVLADEQVIDGKCERCSSIVEKRNLEQWFFRITTYADRLLNNIEKLDWTEKVKIAQRLWIGKKRGIEITYNVEGSKEKIACFTTTPVNFACTFLVLAPEHPAVLKITKSDQLRYVKAYIDSVKNRTQQERIEQGKEKTGVFTGAYAINHVTGEQISVWVSDFVLMEVGTGAVQGCPGHDMRDFEFAKKFGLPIKRVVVGSDGDTSPIDRSEQVIQAGEPGKMINSEFLNGLEYKEAMQKTMDYFEEKGWGKRVTTYHLRDWLISRQRYWGPPIPMIYCENCAKSGKSWFTTEEAKEYRKLRIKNYELRKKEIDNSKLKIENSAAEAAGWYPVAIENLPVELPFIKDYKPLGIHSASSGQAAKAPLANHPEFYETTCPECGGPARRETDVSDNFLDSAWYFFRYIATEKENEAFDRERVEKWLPVTMYIGGAEHSVLHLLYSRFVTMFFYDQGLIDFDEPYKRFYAHGLLIKEGTKMSKSKGNVIIPDEYIRKFGADTLRTYLMFLGPFNQGGDFYDSAMEGMYRFLKRVWRLLSENSVGGVLRSETATPVKQATSAKGLRSPHALRMMHKTIKKVTEDLENLRYNTAIAALMEWYNFLASQKEVSQEEKEVFTKLLSPFAPHMTEELWEAYGNNYSVHSGGWPTYDPSYLQEDEVTIVVQINGKVRETLQMQQATSKKQEEVEEKAKESEKIRKYLQGKTVKKVIFVGGKIINFVLS